ncbi:hypothetical protein H312_03083 [Anncaliia algerae PRA339]|uniref:Uncharacterized protein n=1 Tax=Anncaliia algerae PRA339 TaxID=1288291 RepID=A0A059EX95_9MICR|nr:hypothetical protein H312_03083 [Anncaliia algerae PRA339]
MLRMFLLYLLILIQSNKNTQSTIKKGTEESIIQEFSKKIRYIKENCNSSFIYNFKLDELTNDNQRFLLNLIINKFNDIPSVGFKFKLQNKNLIGQYLFRAFDNTFAFKKVGKYFESKYKDTNMKYEAFSYLNFYFQIEEVLKGKNIDSKNFDKRINSIDELYKLIKEIEKYLIEKFNGTNTMESYKSGFFKILLIKEGDEEKVYMDKYHGNMNSAVEIIKNMQLNKSTIATEKYENHEKSYFNLITLAYDLIFLYEKLSSFYLYKNIENITIVDNIVQLAKSSLLILIEIESKCIGPENLSKVNYFFKHIQHITKIKSFPLNKNLEYLHMNVIEITKKLKEIKT